MHVMDVIFMSIDVIYTTPYILAFVGSRGLMRPLL